MPPIDPASAGLYEKKLYIDKYSALGTNTVFKLRCKGEAEETNIYLEDISLKNLMWAELRGIFNALSEYF